MELGNLRSQTRHVSSVGTKKLALTNQEHVSSFGTKKAALTNLELRNRFRTCTDTNCKH